MVVVVLGVWKGADIPSLTFRHFSESVTHIYQCTLRASLSGTFRKVCDSHTYTSAHSEHRYPAPSSWRKQHGQL